MEALIGPLMSILGKYALDQGTSLLSDAGQAARDVAGRLFARVMDRLKADPAEARNAERFASNPEGYQAPVADALTEKLAADPDFASELETLLADFQRAAGPAATSILQTGSGGLAVGEGSVAAGKGGVAVGGNLSGGVRIGKSG